MSPIISNLSERESAEVKVVEASNKSIRLQLNSKADPKLYDLPLTLLTHVPTPWKKCSITQGAQKTSVSVSNSTASYDALPRSAEIVLQKDSTP